MKEIDEKDKNFFFIVKHFEVLDCKKNSSFVSSYMVPMKIYSENLKVIFNFNHFAEELKKNIFSFSTELSFLIFILNTVTSIIRGN